MEQQAVDAFDWLGELWVPILLALVGLVLGLWKYGSEKEHDRIAALREEKRKAFLTYIAGLDGLINHHTAKGYAAQAEMILRAKTAYNEMTLRTQSDSLKVFSALMDAALAFSNALDRERKAGASDGTAMTERREAAALAYNAALLKAVNTARAEFGLSTDPVAKETVHSFVLPAVADGEAPEAPKAPKAKGPE